MPRAVECNVALARDLAARALRCQEGEVPEAAKDEMVLGVDL